MMEVVVLNCLYDYCSGNFLNDVAREPAGGSGKKCLKSR